MDIPEYIACKRGKGLCSWGQLHVSKGVWLRYIRKALLVNTMS
jgi:hypothetical protein